MKRLFTIAAAVCISSPAHAFEIEYPERYDRERLRPQVRAWVQKQAQPVKRKPPKLVGVVIEPLRPNDPENYLRPKCYPALRVVGDQYVSIEGAKGEAIKAWSQQARHDHGERAMDWEYAKDATFACVRSSIGSVVGQVFHRCEVIAVPCHPRHEPREK